MPHGRVRDRTLDRVAVESRSDRCGGLRAGSDLARRPPPGTGTPRQHHSYQTEESIHAQTVDTRGTSPAYSRSSRRRVVAARPHVARPQRLNIRDNRAHRTRSAPLQSGSHDSHRVAFVLDASPTANPGRESYDSARRRVRNHDDCRRSRCAPSTPTADAHLGPCNSARSPA